MVREEGICVDSKSYGKAEKEHYDTDTVSSFQAGIHFVDSKNCDYIYTHEQDKLKNPIFWCHFDRYLSNLLCYAIIVVVLILVSQH
jgi:hypothetical protein